MVFLDTIVVNWGDGSLEEHIINVLGSCFIEEVLGGSKAHKSKVGSC